jgi:large subunit ribosomal protein L24
MRRLRKGDDVVVRTGRDKGKRGTITRVLDEQTVLVEGINLVKRHTRPNPQQGVSGGIVEKELPIQASNVGLFNPTTGKADRVGIRRLEDGKMVRYFKSNDEVVDV